PRIVFAGQGLSAGVDLPIEAAPACSAGSWRAPNPTGSPRGRATGIPGGLSIGAGHLNWGDLIQPHEFRQVQGVFGIGLDAFTGWALQLARCEYCAPDASVPQVSVESESCRSGLIRHRYRPGQARQP